MCDQVTQYSLKALCVGDLSEKFKDLGLIDNG